MTAQTCTGTHMSLEETIDRVLTFGKIAYSDRLLFLLASLWDKPLNQDEVTKIKEICHRLENKWVKVIE